MCHNTRYVLLKWIWTLLLFIKNSKLLAVTAAHTKIQQHQYTLTTALTCKNEWVCERVIEVASSEIVNEWLSAISETLARELQQVHFAINTSHSTATKLPQPLSQCFAQSVYTALNQIQNSDYWIIVNPYRTLPRIFYTTSQCICLA